MNYETLFAETERKYGLPAGYLARTAQIESSYNPNARNKDTGAAGLFQFIPSTAQSYGLSNPYDPYASTDAAGRLARDNMAHLRNALGREPTAAELYVAHQQGAAGAAKLLTNPGEIVGGAEITLNGGSNGQTGGSFAQQWIDKFNNGTPGDAPQYFGEIDVDAPTWDPTTYLGVDGAAPPTDWDRISIEEQHPEAFSNWFEKVGANYESAGITAHLSNWFSEGADDPDFTPDQVFSVEGLKQYPDLYHDYLLGSSSAENAKTRIKWVEEDMVRQARLAQDPSITAALAAGVVDPVPLAIGVLTGGLGYMAEGGVLARAAAGAAAGAAVNAGTDYAAAQITDDPYADPVMAGIIGGALGAVGGALTRGARPLPEAQIAYDAADRVVRQVPEADYSDAHLKSVGAAQNPLVMDSLGGKDADYLTAMSDEAVPTGYGQISIPGTDKTVNLDVSVTGQMVQAKNPFTRLLGMNLFEPAAGVSKYAVTPDSASVRQKALYRRFTGNFMYEYHPALMGYLKEQGIGRMNVAARQRASKEFARAVRGVIESPEEHIDANPFVKQAAAAFQKGMAGWAKEISESGMADLDVNPRYFPKMASHERITDLDVRFQAEQIHGLIEAAILKHTPTLDRKLVARMAKGYWKTLRRAAYGMDDAIDRSIRMGDLEGFKKAMAEALEGSDRLSDDELAAAWDALTGALESTGKAAEGAPSKGVARLKKRTLLDYNEKVSVPDRQGRVHRLSVGDMFEDDAEMVFGRYARGMSGRVAFAKMRIENPSTGALIMDGVKSEGDLQKLDNYLRESYRQMGLPSSVYEKEMENASRNLKFAWHKINGIPMFDGSLWYNRWARRIKLMQFTRLMSNMGLNQVQETWKLLSLVGGRAALSQMPSIRGMVRSVKEGRISGDQLLEELTHTTGLGLDGLHERLTLQIEDERLGSPAMGSFGRSFDNVLDTAADFTSKISLMRVIHDYQQRWALKAVTQRVVDMARAAGTQGADGKWSFDMDAVPRNEWHRLASMGLGKDDAEMLFRNLLDNGEFDGKLLVGANVSKWDPEAVTKFRHFVGRYVDRLVQQNDHGALAKWMSNPVASMFTQFRPFVFGAWAKSTLWTIHHHGLTDPRMMVLVLGELAAGMATYAIRQGSQLSTEDGRDKFLEEMSDPAKLLANGWARTATASIAPMLIDTMLLVGEQMDLGTKPVFGNARSSGSALDAWIGTPLVGQGAEAIRAARGIKQAVVDGEEMSQSEIKSLFHALPLPTNYVPFSAALGALIQDRPEK